MRRRQTRAWQRIAFLAAIATLVLTFHNVAMMRRAGVTAETFQVSMAIKASGPPSRVPGTYGMNAALVVLPNGRELREGAGGGEVAPEIYK